MQGKAVFAVVSLAFIAHVASPYKVLLYPSNIKSHFLFFGQFANALAEHNHQVHMLAPSNVKPPSDLEPAVKILIYDVTDEESFMGSDEMSSYQMQILNSSLFEWIALTKDMNDKVDRAFKQDCEDLLNNAKLINQLLEFKYDLIVFDVAGYRCTLALPYKLGLPMAMVSIPCFDWFLRSPMLPSSTPNVLSANSDVMTFAQRFQNLLWELFTYYLLLEDNAEYIVKFVPEKEPQTAADILSRDAVLWFALHDHVTHYPRPNMPDTVNIGDLMQRPGKPLSRDFNRLMSTATHGVILMSLGTNFKQVSSEIILKFCKAFQMIDSKLMVVWKTDETPDCELPSNVLIKSWVPQNDLLAHSNLKLFVTHCGWNSYVEAAYHGKPMIGFPLWLDQPHNAVAMETKGLGITMNLMQFKGEELAENIALVLNNDTFVSNARKLSERMRHREIPAKQKIAHWVEHVIKYGGKHLESGGKELSLIQFLMLDILFVLSLICIAVVFFFMLACYFSVKIIKKCCRSAKKQKLKQN